VTYRQIALDVRVHVLLSTVALAIAFAAGGVYGLAGMAIGLSSSLFGVYILWQLICIIGKAITEGGNPTVGAIMTGFGFFLKVPILILAYMAATHIGYAAPDCFLAGLMLVYFAVVAWAIARH
jgi:hypothetical protein